MVLLKFLAKSDLRNSGFSYGSSCATIEVEGKVTFGLVNFPCPMTSTIRCIQVRCLLLPYGNRLPRERSPAVVPWRKPYPSARYATVLRYVQVCSASYWLMICQGSLTYTSNQSSEISKARGDCRGLVESQVRRNLTWTDASSEWVLMGL